MESLFHAFEEGRVLHSAPTSSNLRLPLLRSRRNSVVNPDIDLKRQWNGMNSSSVAMEKGR